MTEAVLDASVVLKWFGRPGQRHIEAALGLRARFQAGSLVVLAPPLLLLEILNVAGRRWTWPADAMVKLAASLDQIGFELQEPELARVAHWIGAGLTAYDAAYVALAQTCGVPLVTDDQLILATAPGIALPLAEPGAWPQP